jgi:hypothetical protein
MMHRALYAHRKSATAAVAAAAANKQPDGTFTAARIDVGRGDVVP